MATRERVYERRLRRPLDAGVRKAIDDLFHRRRGEIPVHTELHWHPAEPLFSLRSRWMTVVGRFSADQLVVDAELSLAARLMATPELRARARRMLDELLEDLGI